MRPTGAAPIADEIDSMICLDGAHVVARIRPFRSEKELAIQKKAMQPMRVVRAEEP